MHVLRALGRSEAVELAGAEGFLLPPAVRNAAFRERGDQIMRDHFRPLIPMP